MDTIGGRLRKFRKSKDMVLVEFCRVIRVSQSSISDLENDKSKPSADTLISLIENTDINIYWLLTGQGKMKRR